MADLLLAEDEEVLRMLITDTLEDEGYEIDVAADGREAFAKLEKETYRLVIVDYMMPEMTGIEVVQKAKAMPAHRETIFVLLTARNQQADRDEAKLAGVDHFFSKPFSPQAFAEKIRSILNG